MRTIVPAGPQQIHFYSTAWGRSYELNRESAAEAIVARIRAEIGQHARVIASGGLAAVIGGETPVIERVEPHLVLYGLRAHYLTL